MSGSQHGGAAPCLHVVTTVTLYRAALVDIRHSRTVHSVDTLPCLLDPRTAGDVDCCAVHYGYCVPVIVRFVDPSQPPTIEVDLSHFSVPTSPTTTLTPDSLMLALAAASGSPSSPRSSSSAILSAVEKFERKTLQHSPVGAAKTRGKVQVTKDSKASPSTPAVSKNGSAEVTKPSKSKDADQPPNAVAADSASPKYSSSTWPSFQRTPTTPTSSKFPKPAAVTTTATAAMPVAESVGSVAKAEKTPVIKEVLKVEPKKPEAKVEPINSPKITKSNVTTTPNNKLSSKDSPKVKQVTIDKHVKIATTPDIVNKTKRKAESAIKKSVGKKESLMPSKSDANDILQQELEKILSVTAPLTIITDAAPSLAKDGKAGHSNNINNNNTAGVSNGSGSASPKYIENFIQSPVDYAKTRFQNVQNQKTAVAQLEEAVKTVQNGTPSYMVTEAKTRFENGQIHNSSYDKWRTEWLPSQQAFLDPSAAVDASVVQATVDALKKDSRQQQRLRKALSPEPNNSSSASLPHPKLTVSQKQHIRERSLSPTGYNAHMPIRPFLTKGSVAERVMIFERCPTVDRDKPVQTTMAKIKQPLNTMWRADVHAKAQAAADRENHRRHSAASTSPRGGASTGTLGRLSKSAQNLNIPRFYFPNGRPHNAKDAETVLQRVATAFSNLEGGRATKEQFGAITKACDLPLYWKVSLFVAVAGDKKDSITSNEFLDYWKRVLSSCHDDASKFIHILSKGSRNYLVPEDFVPLIQDAVNTHPGLTFLKEAIEFHSRYVHTVIARIYYCVNRSWSGQIVASELRKSNFLQVLAVLEEEDDINQITEYFSYEHFYVIYCKFWELDKDHDLFIDKNDLSRHNDHAISTRMIDRIFSGAVTRGRTHKEQKMSYAEFVWFLISEEDKQHPTSVEYWFRCMDLDGDGFLSMYELEYFYEEQLQRMDGLGIETLPFKDCLCQMLDMIRPQVPGLISLSDLKHCRMTTVFFDTFFNLEKYLDHEQRDPFASQREGDMPDLSDWDRFAADEYEFLVAEEGSNAQQEDLAYDDEDELSPNLDKLVMGDYARRQQNMNLEDDYADYADYADSDDYQY